MLAGHGRHGRQGDKQAASRQAMLEGTPAKEAGRLAEMQGCRQGGKNLKKVDARGRQTGRNAGNKAARR